MKTGSDLAFFDHTTILAEKNIGKPFAILLNADDPEWSNKSYLENRIREILDLGCCYIVCFGDISEYIHDCIDDMVLDHSNNGAVITTFHNEEKLEEVLEFFKLIAMDGMNGGVMLLKNNIMDK
jgi:hypothetical protein